MLGQRNVYLIGPMGSGKTAVGRRLAALLGKQFFDSDAEIEKRTGVDIRYIFEKEGEARFRDREREVIADLTALDGVVVATGGGVILDAGEPRPPREDRHRRLSRDQPRHARAAHASRQNSAAVDERRPARRARAPDGGSAPVVRDSRGSAHRDDGPPSARRRGRHPATARAARCKAARLLENLRPRGNHRRRTRVSAAIRSTSGPSCSASRTSTASRRSRFSSSPTRSSRRCICSACRPRCAAASFETLILPDGERHKTLATLHDRHRPPHRRAVPSRLLPRRARRRRDRRPDGLRRGELPARRRFRADSDDAARASRLFGRRQDGRQPSARRRT